MLVTQAWRSDPSSVVKTRHNYRCYSSTAREAKTWLISELQGHWEIPMSIPMVKIVEGTNANLWHTHTHVCIRVHVYLHTHLHIHTPHQENTKILGHFDSYFPFLQGKKHRDHKTSSSTENCHVTKRGCFVFETSLQFQVLVASLYLVLRLQPLWHRIPTSFRGCQAGRRLSPFPATLEQGRRCGGAIIIAEGLLKTRI